MSELVSRAMLCMGMSRLEYQIWRVSDWGQGLGSVLLWHLLGGEVFYLRIHYLRLKSFPRVRSGLQLVSRQWLAG